MNTIILDDFVENGKNEISIIFNYNEELISMARRIRELGIHLNDFGTSKKIKKT